MIVLKEAKGIWRTFVSSNIETFAVKDLQRHPRTVSVDLDSKECEEFVALPVVVLFA